MPRTYMISYLRWFIFIFLVITVFYNLCVSSTPCVACKTFICRAPRANERGGATDNPFMVLCCVCVCMCSSSCSIVEHGLLHYKKKGGTAHDDMFTCSQRRVTLYTPQSMMIFTKQRKEKKENIFYYKIHVRYLFIVVGRET